MNNMSVENKFFSYKNYQAFLDKWTQPSQKDNNGEILDLNNQEMHNYLKIIRQVTNDHN